MLPFRDSLRLFRRAIFGIFNRADLGKPAERRGRKATGLKRGAMTAGLPAGRKLIVKETWLSGRDQREQGEQRPRQAGAYGLRCLPADTGICTHPERTA